MLLWIEIAVCAYSVRFENLNTTTQNEMEIAMGKKWWMMRHNILEGIILNVDATLHNSIIVPISMDGFVHQNNSILKSFFTRLTKAHVSTNLQINKSTNQRILFLQFADSMHFGFIVFGVTFGQLYMSIFLFHFPSLSQYCLRYGEYNTIYYK